jgi:hypothetical protein
MSAKGRLRAGRRTSPAMKVPLFVPCVGGDHGAYLGETKSHNDRIASGAVGRRGGRKGPTRRRNAHG